MLRFPPRASLLPPPLSFLSSRSCTTFPLPCIVILSIPVRFTVSWTVRPIAGPWPVRTLLLPSGPAGSFPRFDNFPFTRSRPFLGPNYSPYTQCQSGTDGLTRGRSEPKGLLLGCYGRLHRFRRGIRHPGMRHTSVTHGGGGFRLRLLHSHLSVFLFRMLRAQIRDRPILGIPFGQGHDEPEAKAAEREHVPRQVPSL